MNDQLKKVNFKVDESKEVYAYTCNKFQNTGGKKYSNWREMKHYLKGNINLKDSQCLICNQEVSRNSTFNHRFRIL